MQDFLEKRLGCKVDLGTYNSLKPYMKKEVDRDLILVS
jgi:predicted nucleotidyltransferase